MLDKYRVFAPIFYYRERWWVRMSAQIYNDVNHTHLFIESQTDSNIFFRSAITESWARL